MKVDDTLLLAYVDGDLSAQCKAEVAAAVGRSAELAGRLTPMRASVLPYGAAFDRQALPPVPPALTKRIAELVGVEAGARSSQRRTACWPRLAASFAAGALFCGVLLKLLSVRATCGANRLSARTRRARRDVRNAGRTSG